MSFFSHPRNIRPGPKTGNPLNGLCHRIAISARRILDAARIEETFDNCCLTTYGIPIDIPTPLRVKSVNSTNLFANTSSLAITRIPERPDFAAVSILITIPLTIEYECAEGKLHKATSSISTPQNIILYVPRQSIFPFEIEVTSSTQAVSASFDTNFNLTGTICCTLIIRVIAETDILVPAYGLAPAPPAVPYDRNACKDFFDLPLYPRGTSTTER